MNLEISSTMENKITSSIKELSILEMKNIEGGSNIIINTILIWLGIERDVESVT
ncbi:MAG: hypothetical protein ABFS12_14550 [Bacteroidota bacterium]